jgi:hypothetical protein
MRTVMLCVVVLVAVRQGLTGEPQDQLAPPIHVLVDGKPLDTAGKGQGARGTRRPPRVLMVVRPQIREPMRRRLPVPPAAM